MFICNCGKEYKTETGFVKHQKNCPYIDLNINKIYNLGYMIDNVDKRIFYVPVGKIKKKSKENNITFEEAKKIIQQENIYKYRKALWDILIVWKNELIPSEYRHFLKWCWKTYKDITVLSMKRILGNSKVLYRYNLEHTSFMIGKRIDDSLIHVHEHGDFSNDFEFVANIISGNISMYYVLFNDWLATQWFGRLDIDLQNELNEYVEIASKTVLERLKKKEFDLLQQLACTVTPKIYDMDF